MINRLILNSMADRLEATLYSFHRPGWITGGQVAPGGLTFHLQPGSGIRLSEIKSLAPELARALSRPSCEVRQAGDHLELWFPGRPRARSPLELARQVGRIKPMTAILGQSAEDGVPLLLRLDSPDVAHVLIAGTTGSGKTELARTMIASLALHNGLHEVGLLLIDPKKRGFFPLGELPHLVRPIAAGGREMLAGLRWAVNQLDRGEPWPALVVFIDELADLLMTVPEAEGLITRLVQRGREAGIHVVAATQTPRADVVAGLIRANFPVRIVGRVTDQVEAQIAAGRSDSGAERLAGRGSFVLVAGLELRRFQAAMLAENEIEELYRRVGGRAKLPEPEDLAAIEEPAIGAITSSIGAGVGKWLPLLAEHGGDVAALRSGEISQAELFRRIGAPAAGAEWQNARAALMLFEQMMGGNGGGEK